MVKALPLSEIHESNDSAGGTKPASKGLLSDSNARDIQGSSASANKPRNRRKRSRLDPSTKFTAGIDTCSTSSKGDILTDIHTNETDTASEPSTTTETTRVIEPFATVDPLTSLPLELLGEVLTLTRSTADILSVARCSKHFWQTLTASSSAFIWMKARQTTIPEPMPEPPSVLLEYAYASMVFDGARCQVCEKFTKEMYCSFAVRFRLCPRLRCRKTELKRCGLSYLMEEEIWDRTPTIEHDTTLYKSVPSTVLSSASFNYWPHAQLWCKTTEKNKVLKEYQQEVAEFKDTEDFEELQRKRQHAIMKNKEWMEFCVALSKWRDSYTKEYHSIRRQNDLTSRKIAQSMGYKVQELFDAASYVTLLRVRNKSLQAITRDDIRARESQIKAEVIAATERRKRSQRCASYRIIWEAIQKYHEKLRNETPSPDVTLVVPPFPTFRRLPVFASLLALADPGTSKCIRDILKKDSVRDVVKTELEKWENEARKEMAVILGHPEDESEWGESHPVDHWSAWFLCKQCTARAVQYKTGIEPLCFRDACQHECYVPKGQKRRADPWDALNFTKDEKAIVVLQKCASRFKSSDLPSSMTVKCLSCQPYAIIQTTRDLVFHCHRHDDMEIDFPDADNLESEMPIGGYAIATPGLAKTLLRRRTDKERNLKDCGCRSCLLEAARRKYTDAGQNELLAKQHRMTINGLRSHLKSKHGVEVLRDEDVYIFPS